MAKCSSCKEVMQKALQEKDRRPEKRQGWHCALSA